MSKEVKQNKLYRTKNGLIVKPKLDGWIGVEVVDNKDCVVAHIEDVTGRVIYPSMQIEGRFGIDVENLEEIE